MLALRDANQDVSLFTIPRACCLNAGRNTCSPATCWPRRVERRLERLLGAAVDLSYKLDYADLEALAGGDEVWMKLDGSVQLEIDGAVREYKGRFAVPREQIGELLAAEGRDAADEAAVQEALVRAVLASAALLPDAERAVTIDRVVKAARGGERRYLREILTAATEGDADVERLPSVGKTPWASSCSPGPGRIMARDHAPHPGSQPP